MKNFSYPSVSVIDGLELKRDIENNFQEIGKYVLNERTRKKYIVFKGSHSDVATNKVEVAVEQIETLREDKYQSSNKFDQFEGEAAEILHKNLKDLPLSILSDFDFWRYVSIVSMFDLIVWRMGSTHNNNFGLSNSSVKRCFPYRMFIRADLAYRFSEGKDYKLATQGATGQDQWASHVISQTYGCSPYVVEKMLGEFVKLRTPPKTPKPTEVDREIAKSLCAARSVYVMEFFDYKNPINDILNQIVVDSKVKINGKA